MRKQGSILRHAVVVLAVVLPLAGLAGGASAHLVRFGGSLTVTFVAETNVFKGRVSSPKARCEPGRRVDVFHVIDGPDHLVAWDRTNSEGRWRVVYDAEPGDYYAKARSKDIGPGAHRHICRSIRTATFEVTP